MFMLKMCMRRFAAAVTKSIAAGSSWREEFDVNHWKHTHTHIQNLHRQQMQPQNPSPCPRPAQLLLPSPAAGSIESPRCAGRADIGPRAPELVGPSTLLLQKPLELKLGHTDHITYLAQLSWGGRRRGGLRKAKTHSSSLDGASPEE